MLSTRVAAVLEEYGSEIWGHLVDRLFDLGRELADQVEQRPDFELAMRPEANIVCFRHLPPSLTNEPVEKVNRHVEGVRKALLEGGPHYIVMTRFNGEVWLRCTLMNPLTEPADLKAMLDRVERLSCDQGCT